MMKKKPVVKILIVCAVIGLIALAGYWRMFRDMTRLPHGELIASHASPTKEYTFNVYLCRGGATVADSIRGELESEGVRKNIFWQYREDSAEVTWMSPYRIHVNGITLDVRNDVYDWRNDSLVRTAGVEGG